MKNIIGAIGEAGMPVVFPVHPRTKKFLEEYGLWNRMHANIIITEPLGYLDMLKLMRHASKILTDSGGIQKEAYILRFPCITLRDVTEWMETVVEGGNVLVGADIQDILLNINRDFPEFSFRNALFGDGNAAQQMSKLLHTFVD